MSLFKYLPNTYFVLGLIFSGVAFYLSLIWHDGILKIYNLSNLSAVGGGVDVAADGGALGFAILSGICFACCAYLTKKNQ